MVGIDSKRFELSFDKKLAKSLEPFLRYFMFFLGNLQNRFFEFLSPVKCDFFFKTFLTSCVFKLSFERVVAELMGSIFH